MDKQPIDLAAVWADAIKFDSFLRGSVKHKGLWEVIYRLARIPDWVPNSVTGNDQRRLLVIAEDWCGDASSTIPVLAKWVAQTPGLALSHHQARRASRGDGPVSDERRPVDSHRDRAGRNEPRTGTLGSPAH